MTSSFLNYREISNPTQTGYIYDNQFAIAKEIMIKFSNNQCKWIILQAQTQCGKTGVIRQLADYINNNEIMTQLNIISTRNIFCIMGMNDNELKQQTINRMPDNTIVLHNSDIRSLLSRFHKGEPDAIDLIWKMKNKSLITIDESHYAQNKNSQIHKLLQVLNVSPNGDMVLNNNIHILSVSATSMSESANNSSYKQSVILTPGNRYYGIADIFDNNKIFQARNLNESVNINHLANIIVGKSINTNGYFIIRLTGMRIKQLKIRNGISQILINKNIDTNIIDYCMSNIDLLNINDILNIVPEKPTIIYIKNRLRAGVSINTDNIMVLYDSYKSSCDVVSQSLLGRLCGYNRNGICEVYCNKINAHKYLLWVNNDFNINFIPTGSKNIKAIRFVNVPIRIIPCRNVKTLSTNAILVLRHFKECNQCKLGMSRNFNYIYKFQLIIENYIILTELKVDDLYTTIADKFSKNKEINYFKKKQKNKSITRIKDTIHLCIVIDFRNPKVNGTIYIIHENIDIPDNIRTTKKEMFNII
jgi:hypothetical protein